MKRIIAVFLLGALSLGMLACGRKAPEATAGTTVPQTTGARMDVVLTDPHTGIFRAGYDRQLITPQEPLPLGGYGNTNTRISENILDDLYITCVAISDEKDNTVLLFGGDIIRNDDFVEVARHQVSAATGIPEDHIITNVSHTHSAPQGGEDAPSLRWETYFQEQTVKAAVNALNDRIPVTEAQVGDVEAPGVGFIRHYVLEDGSYAGDSFGDFDAAPIKDHTAQADNTVHMLNFKRDGGKDVLICNFRAHPTSTGFGNNAPKLDVSADYVHPWREAIESLADCHFLFLQGAAGNTNAGSKVSGEAVSNDYMTKGSQLAKCTYEGLQNNMKTVEVGDIQTQRYMLEVEVDHSMDDRIFDARVIQTLWSTTNDRELVYAQGRPIGIRSPYHANAIVGNYNRPATDQLQINCITIGDVFGLVTAPNEIMDANSQYVEAHSPYEMTFTLGYTNDSKGYIPAAYVWEYTSYETDVTWFVPGTGELIQNTMLDLLNQAKNG